MSRVARLVALAVIVACLAACRSGAGGDAEVMDEADGRSENASTEVEDTPVPGPDEQAEHVDPDLEVAEVEVNDVSSDREVGPCVPDCAGRSCGHDGCGGSCGMCAAEYACSSSGGCVGAPSFSGCYDVESAFTFVEPAGPPVDIGMVATLILDLCYDPGTFLFDQTLKVLKADSTVAWDALPAEATEALKQALYAAFANWFIVHPPDWVSCFFETVSEALRDVTSAFVLRGTLCLVPGGVVTLVGHEYWVVARVAWPGACQSGPCDIAGLAPPAEVCLASGMDGACACSTEAARFSPYLASPTPIFNAFIDDDGVLNISAYDVGFDYNELAEWVLGLLLDYASGGLYPDVKTLLGTLVDCQAVAATVPANVAAEVGFTTAELTAACKKGLNILVDPIQETLAIQRTLWLRGTGEISAWGDGALAAAIRGKWEGTLSVFGDPIGLTGSCGGVRVVPSGP